VTTYRRPYPPGGLTTQQAAVVLGVSVDTVMRWLSEGRLAELERPSGRRPRFFAQAEVEAFAAMRGGERLPREWHGLDLSGLAPDDPLRERFWVKVDKNGTIPAHCPELGPCWLYTEHTDEAGYGKFVLRRGDFRPAHAVSYALAKGPVPPRLHVCHHCDNPPCVRPEHLFTGTAADNTRDMFAKGRQGSRHPGSERANARLTEEQVQVIRAVPPYFGRDARLAREFGVSQTTIRKIIAGQKWRHVA
jgi:excisionase family DNA binding protein